MYMCSVSHHQRLVNARDKIKATIGQKVTIEQGRVSARKKIEWEVIAGHEPPIGWNRERKYIGRIGLDLDSIHRHHIFARIFWHLLCKDLQKLIHQMNVAVSIKNLSIG
jgi:hypothetical protein